jgi:hypothetical protein
MKNKLEKKAKLFIEKDIIEYKKVSKKQDKIDVSKEKKRQEFLKKLRERY